MWNECKGFIAVMVIFALAACLIITGMLIEREASNKELPRLSSREISMNFGVATKAQKFQKQNYAHANMAKVKNTTNIGLANLAPASYSYSVAPYAKIKPPTNLGVAPHASVIVYPNNIFLSKKFREKNQ
ncbi:MAG TPA: hypothetical protein DHV30_06220 [Balneola sp.]|nr:hypothetical protein [Balneola sp.]